MVGEGAGDQLLATPHRPLAPRQDNQIAHTIEEGGLRIGQALRGVEGTLMGPSRLRTVTTAEPG